MSDKILEVSDLQIRYVTDEETVRAVNGVYVYPTDHQLC